MIISKAPNRISFFGGGTDFPEYFLEHEGAVLSTSINKYTYVTVNNLLGFFDHKIRVSYSKTELVEAVDEIKHDLVREVLRHMEVPGLVEINIFSDLPARTGLGSSGSFLVAFINAMHALKGKYISQQDLAKMAIYVERDLVKANVGLQDQAAAAVGGLNIIRFSNNNSISYEPIPVRQDRLHELQSNLILIYTGITRDASLVSKEQVERTKVNVPYLHEIKSLVAEGHRVLMSEQSLSEFGKLLHQAWTIKKSLSSKITSNVIESVYEKGLKAGAFGGKLLGAGGGGFVLFYVEPQNREALKIALSPCKEVPFSFESLGSRIVYHQSSSSQ